VITNKTIKTVSREVPVFWAQQKKNISGSLRSRLWFVYDKFFKI